MYILRIVVTLISLTLVCGICLACQNSPALQANAGEDFDVNVGDSPTFDGCLSEGEIDNYKWTVLDAPDSMPEYDGKVIREIDANCSFTLEASMLADEVGEWEIELLVDDGQGNSSADTVMVSVVQ
ncbi:hypothetical protein KFU94_54195 [Chloroflexi bacterium TSY]|nr:hypothetical protein [Chloroflexi bacterium TSY]